MRMIASKPFSYATRRLKAGDVFEASNRDGRVLLAARRARVLDALPAPAPEIPARLRRKAVAEEPTPPVAPEEAMVSDTPSTAPQPNEDGDLDALREEAESLGIAVDGRWGAKRLREAIESAAADE